MLHGNLAPDGAVIKHARRRAARCCSTRGPAVVFDDYDDLSGAHRRPGARRSTARLVLVLQNAGPLGRAGHARVGHAADPEEAAASRACATWCRISDARMSGTSYGTCVLHVAPEAPVGGPLALVRDGDLIELDVEARRLDLQVERRPSSRAAAPHWRAAEPPRHARLRRALRRSTSRRPTRAATSTSSARATTCPSPRSTREVLVE